MVPDSLRLAPCMAREHDFNFVAKCGRKTSARRAGNESELEWSVREAEIVIDGSCPGEPRSGRGPGGWACILQYGHPVQDFISRRLYSKSPFQGIYQF
jgi:hypothetical protein